jgi:hypothetical protein
MTWLGNIIVDERKDTELLYGTGCIMVYEGWFYVFKSEMPSSCGARFWEMFYQYPVDWYETN